LRRGFQPERLTDISQPRSGWNIRGKRSQVPKGRGKTHVDCFRRPFRTVCPLAPIQALRAWLMSGVAFATMQAAVPILSTKQQGRPRSLHLGNTPARRAPSQTKPSEGGAAKRTIKSVEDPTSNRGRDHVSPRNQRYRYNKKPNPFSEVGLKGYSNLTSGGGRLTNWLRQDPTARTSSVPEQELPEPRRMN
jgi:hypothetical protein